jgi:hypothetical protein
LEHQLQAWRDAFSAHEEELAIRKADLEVLERELARTTSTQDLEHEWLEVLDPEVTATEASYAQRLEKANTNLAAKEKKLQENADSRVTQSRKALAKEHRDKLKLQEDRFKTRHEELLHVIACLKEMLTEAENC